MRAKPLVRSPQSRYLLTTSSTTGLRKPYFFSYFSG